MQRMKLFIDTHDQRRQSFPKGITKEALAEFFGKYEAVAREEGVIVLKLHAGLEDGRAFCLTMAPSAEHVRRAHQRIGLPFDEITEVTTMTPNDLLGPAAL